MKLLLTLLVVVCIIGNIVVEAYPWYSHLPPHSHHGCPKYPDQCHEYCLTLKCTGGHCSGNYCNCIDCVDSGSWEEVDEFVIKNY